MAHPPSDTTDASGPKPTYRYDGKQQPIIANKEWLERIIGRLLPTDPDLWSFFPLGRRIVVVCEEAQEATTGGIIIPDQARERPAVGWVLSAGPDVGVVYTENDPGYWPFSNVDLLGTKVVFGKYAGYPLEIGDIAENSEDPFKAEFVVITDKEIWGYLDSSKEAKHG